jgi:hypothetical protein
MSRSINSPEFLPARTFLSAMALVALALSPVVASSTPAGPDQDIDVRVQKNGAEVIVDVDCPVRASLSVVWDVLTDYDHMADFLSDVQSSSVQTRKGAILHVYQKGKAARGLLSITFENLREVELIPYREIRSQLISGDLKASNFVTRVVDDGTQMHIVHSGRYTPKLWVPPVIGPALIEAETRKHFGELRAEVVRRNQSSKASSPSRPGSLVANPGTLASEAPR